MPEEIKICSFGDLSKCKLLVSDWGCRVLATCLKIHSKSEAELKQNPGVLILLLDTFYKAVLSLQIFIYLLPSSSDLQYKELGFILRIFFNYKNICADLIATPLDFWVCEEHVQDIMAWGFLFSLSKC